MDGFMIEATMRSTLDGWSNSQPPEYEEAWIEEAGEQFKTALRKQLTPRDPEFRVRMSNIGRPLCQLQMEKAGAVKSRAPYNHIMRMCIGDATEVLMRFVMKASGIPVSSDGDRVELSVAGTTIKGDSDIDIAGYVYDIKSSSPWAFENKWRHGWEALSADDSFGYVGQLYGYSDAQGKLPGGWVVMDKSSGEIAVVEANADIVQLCDIRKAREDTVNALNSDRPFERCFTPEPETYYKKPTGATRIPKQCEFCDFLGACWPEAKKLPSPASKAKNPPYHWYIEHPDMPS